MPIKKKILALAAAMLFALPALAATNPIFSRQFWGLGGRHHIFAETVNDTSDTMCARFNNTADIACTNVLSYLAQVHNPTIRSFHVAPTVWPSAIAGYICDFELWDGQAGSGTLITTVTFDGGTAAVGTAFEAFVDYNMTQGFLQVRYADGAGGDCLSLTGGTHFIGFTIVGK